VAQPFEVEQTSMEPTIVSGQYVLIDKISPHFSDYQRGDIVVFNPPAGYSEGGVPFIKRVIGLPGDTVEVRDDGLVYVNGTPLQESYTFANDRGIHQPTTSSGQQRWVIPSGELFVMGDHRQSSADSRVFGPIDVSAVIGRAFLRYWPIQELGILATPTYPGVATAAP
jgi:signal peptidase I